VINGLGRRVPTSQDMDWIVLFARLAQSFTLLKKFADRPAKTRKAGVDVRQPLGRDHGFAAEPNSALKNERECPNGAGFN